MTDSLIEATNIQTVDGTTVSETKIRPSLARSSLDGAK